MDSALEESEAKYLMDVLEEDKARFSGKGYESEGDYLPDTTWESEPESDLISPAPESHCEEATPSPATDDNINSYYSQDGQHRCLECNIDFGLKINLQRHFDTAEAHRSSAFQCRCKQLFGRKDKFLAHVQRKRPCDAIALFCCSCGYEMESDCPDSVKLMLEHVRPCGQRKRGRPKK